MIITNVDLLAISINQEVMFPEYSRNIPRMSVSKTFQGYPRNIVKLWKYFQESKSSKNYFLGYPAKILILSPLLQYFSKLYWNRFTFRVTFWKGSYRSLKLVKISKEHNIIIVIRNPLGQVFNVLSSSTQWQIFVIACFFDIMQFDYMLQKCFSCSYRDSTSLPWELWELLNLLPIGHLPAQSQQ